MLDPQTDQDDAEQGALQYGDDDSDIGGGAGGNQFDNALNTVSDVLDFGRQKYGLTGQGQGQQVAGYIPAVPAGPGGDQTQDNPFGTRTPRVPFGRRTQSFDDGGGVDADNPFNADTRGAYQPEGDDPVGAVLSQGAQSVAQAVQPYQTEQPALAEEGQVEQGPAIAGALSSAAGAMGDRPSADSALSPSSLRTALDPTTFHQNLQNIEGAAQPYVAKIISYLKGGDAASPQAAQQIENNVDPQGQMDPGMRKLLAIDAAAKQYGPQAAWGLMQHYRQKYDAYKSFAAAANSGVQGKPRDPAAAAMALQQAYDHVPDGLNLTVKPSQTGFTATVTQPGGKQQTVSLTPQQFGQLTQGPEGQFDSVLDKGLPSVLTKFVQRNGLTADQVQPDTSTSAPEGSEPTVASANKGQGNVGLGYDPQLEARSRALFPMVSQNPQRIAWLQAQEQQGKENELSSKKIDNTLAAIGLRGQNARTVADIRANAQRDVAQTRGASYDKRTEAQADVGHERNQNYAARTLSNADIAKVRAAAASQSAQERNDAAILQRVISAGQMYDPKNPANAVVEQAARRLNVTLPQSGSQAPAQQRASQAAAPSAAPKAAPQVGEVVKGYRFKGGNPADKNSWEPAGQ